MLLTFVISKIVACVCAFCAAEMAGELIRNQSEKLPVEGACPCLWSRARNSDYKQSTKTEKALTVITVRAVFLVVRPKRFELLTYRFVAYI